MTEKFRTAMLWLRSDNLKAVPRTKIGNRKWAGLLAFVIAFAMCGAAAQAQQPTKIPRIGYLSAGNRSAQSARIDAFVEGLRELGYVEGKSIVIEWRWAEGKFDRVPDLVAEMVRLKVDVIVSAGPAATRAAKEGTSTIPIVMAQDTDPVGTRVRSQPGAAWRKHHWVVLTFAGAKRQTTGASKGDLFLNYLAWRSSDIPRNQANAQRLKRGGTCGKGVRSEGSIPRGHKPQGH